MSTQHPTDKNHFTADDLAGFDPKTELGEPGKFPFTRGVQPTMYRGRPWTMRQYAGFATAAESNSRYRYLLSQGVSGLSVAFDLPTQIGYDSDDALAAGGVKLSIRKDMLRFSFHLYNSTDDVDRVLEIARGWSRSQG